MAQAEGWYFLKRIITAHMSSAFAYPYLNSTDPQCNIDYLSTMGHLIEPKTQGALINFTDCVVSFHCL